MIKEGDATFLNEAIRTLEQDFDEMKRAYERNETEKFNELKKRVLAKQKELVNAAV